MCTPCCHSQQISKKTVAAAELVRKARGSHPVPGSCVHIVLHLCTKSGLRAPVINDTSDGAVYHFAVGKDEFTELVASSGVPSDEISELLETLHKWGLLLYFPKLGIVGELVAYVQLTLSCVCPFHCRIVAFTDHYSLVSSPS